MARSKKDEWIDQIQAASELNVKTLAQIIGVSKSRIYRDLEVGIFENANKNGKGRKSDWVFSKEAALEYIESFQDTKTIENTPRNLTPPSKKLRIPGWHWEE